MKLFNYLALRVAILSCLTVVPVIAQHHHDGLHHWEVPSRDPDRIMLTFHGDPATSRAITWRTDTTITKAVAQIAEATVNSGFTDDAVTMDAKTEPFRFGSVQKQCLPDCPLP